MSAMAMHRPSIRTLVVMFKFTATAAALRHAGRLYDVEPPHLQFLHDGVPHRRRNDVVHRRRNNDVMHDSDVIHQFRPNPDTDRYRYYVSDDVHFVY